MAGAVRRRLVVVGVGVAVALSAAYSVHATGRPAASPIEPLPTPSAGSTGGPTGQAPGAADLAGLLDQRAGAVTGGDRAAWLATLDPAGTPAAERFRATQGRVFDRITGLRPAEWSYRFLMAGPLAADRAATLAGPAYLADVQLTYRITSASPQVHRQQFLSVVRLDGGWRVAADTDGATGRDLWDLAPVVRADSKRCAVVGANAVAELVRELAAQCDRSSAIVDRAWGTNWSRRTVLTVPGSLAQLAVLLGRGGTSTPGQVAKDQDSMVDVESSGRPATPAEATPAAAGGATPSPAATGTAGLERTAALTVGPTAGPADEVLVNGEAFEQLSDLGRGVVLTHELVHVATRSTGSRAAPTWLTEGYADHVAYAGTGLSPEQVAGEALDAVRAGRLPPALPTTSDFDAAGTQAAAAYGGAWVAVDVIARRVRGAEGLREFYRLAAAPPPAGGTTDATLQSALAYAHLADTSALVEAWQARLIALAT